MIQQAYWTDALPRPYSTSDRLRELSRLSADIPYTDKNLIKSVCPKKGVLNQVTQCFFSAICENLREQQITYYSPEHESYLIDLIKSLLEHARGYKRLTASQSLEQAIASNDRERAARAHSDSPRAKQQLNAVKKGTNKRGAKGESNSEGGKRNSRTKK